MLWGTTMISSRRDATKTLRVLGNVQGFEKKKFLNSPMSITIALWGGLVSENFNDIFL